VLNRCKIGATILLRVAAAEEVTLCGGAQAGRLPVSPLRIDRKRL
jgi:hypothetical protein